MKKLLLLILFLINYYLLHAQSNVKNDNTNIRLTYFDMNEHDFLIDVDIVKTAATITYISYDSISFTNVRKDPQYQELRKKRISYKLGDQNLRPIDDSLHKIFQKHRIYTRDSIIVSLKKDWAFKKLMNRILKAKNEELAPPVKINNKPNINNDPNGVTTGTSSVIISDGGNNFNMAIVTSTGKSKVNYNLPDLKGSTILVNYLRATLSKNRNSATVKNILKCYPVYIE